jgi:hypothetical protein
MADETKHPDAARSADAKPDQPKAAKTAAKETKRILQNVVFHDTSYGPGDEDDLEQRLTPERYEQLKAKDPPVLAGDWSPAGKGEDPMPRSFAAREAAGDTSGPTGQQSAEMARLREENAKLKAEAAKHQGKGGK